MPKKTNTTKKTPGKNAAKKAIKKTVATKKAAAKKVPAKKSIAKKKATKKNVAKAPKKQVKKTATTKKATKKKVTPKPAQLTRITARVDVGFGNQLYIRGEGGGLHWGKGLIMENVSAYEWQLTTRLPSKQIEFKFLINDELWAEGDNLTIASGKNSISSPNFIW